MARTKETHEYPWCLNCEDEADEYCFVKDHEVIHPGDIIPPKKPDLTGTPAPQHDVNYY